MNAIEQRLSADLPRLADGLLENNDEPAASDTSPRTAPVPLTRHEQTGSSLARRRPVLVGAVGLVVVLLAAITIFASRVTPTVVQTEPGATSPPPTASAGRNGDRVSTVANGTHLFDHTAPDGNSISVTAGDVSFWGTCNCWVTKPGILINYRGPDGTTLVTSASAGPTPTPVNVVAAWNIGPSFVAIQTSPRVANVKIAVNNGTADELQPVDGWVVFATTAGSSDPPRAGFLRLTALDEAGNLIVWCPPVPRAECH